MPRWRCLSFSSPHCSLLVVTLECLDATRSKEETLLLFLFKLLRSAAKIIPPNWCEPHTTYIHTILHNNIICGCSLLMWNILCRSTSTSFCYLPQKSRIMWWRWRWWHRKLLDYGITLLSRVFPTRFIALHCSTAFLRTDTIIKIIRTYIIQTSCCLVCPVFWLQ